MSRSSSDRSGGVPPKPKSRNASSLIAWSSHWPDQPIDETWVYAPVGKSEWTIGNLIGTVRGAPFVAEARIWPTDSPPWQPRRRKTRRTQPNLDLARHELTSEQALQAWRKRSEQIDQAGGHLLHRFPGLSGFDSMAPTRFRPRHLYLARVAEKFVEFKRTSPPQYAQTLARELDLKNKNPVRAARKLVWECHDQGLLDGEELTPYARWLLDTADTAAE